MHPDTRVRELVRASRNFRARRHAEPEDVGFSVFRADANVRFDWGRLPVRMGRESSLRGELSRFPFLPEHQALIHHARIQSA